MPKILKNTVTNSSCSKCVGCNNGIFAGLDHESADAIRDFKITNHYPKGQPVFFQDNPAFGLFQVHSGKLKLVRSDSYGNDSIIGLINPGEVFGVTNLFTDKPYNTTAVTIEDSTICFFDKKSINEIFANFPLVTLNILKHLSNSLRAAELDCAAKSQRNIREKLAALFISLMKSNGVKIGDHWKLDIRLTREEMAAITGSTIETISRFITEFKNEGLIEEHQKIIHIVNADKLRTFFRE